MKHEPKGVCSTETYVHLNYVKSDTLAMLVADLEAASAELAQHEPTPRGIADPGDLHRAMWDATAMLIALVGQLRADIMITRAAER